MDSGVFGLSDDANYLRSQRILSRLRRRGVLNPSELSDEDILEMQDEITENRDKEYIDLLKEDYFVHEAINVLKALKVITNK